MDLREAEALGDAVGEHWYYRSKAAALRRLIAGLDPQCILDVGAGSGFFSRHLLEHTGAAAAWCIDPNYIHERDERCAGKPMHLRKGCGAVEADLVLMMDVLEHVEDDLGLLRDYAAKVPDGCWFLTSVPAFDFLWSRHDEFLGHHRRYTLAGLARLMRGANLEIQRQAYFFGLVFPLAAVVRLANRLGRSRASSGSDLRRHHPLTNMLLTAICRLELGFLKYNRWAGLTAFCLARKPANRPGP